MSAIAIVFDMEDGEIKIEIKGVDDEDFDPGGDLKRMTDPERLASLALMLLDRHLEIYGADTTHRPEIVNS